LSGCGRKEGLTKDQARKSLSFRLIISRGNGVALCKYFMQSWDIKFIFVDRKEKRIEEEEEYWL